MEKIGVIGSGAWGTAIASLLADNGHEVCIYGIDSGELTDLSLNHQNAKYFGNNYFINSNLVITDNLEKVKLFNDVFVIAVPSFAIKETINKLKDCVSDSTIIINLAKGFDKESQKTVGQTIRSYLPFNLRNNVVSLLGPTYALEVAEKQITAITASSFSYEISSKVKKIFENDYFKVFPNDDPIGSEYCAALKNIIALACGISDGIGNKVNTRSALITEGLKEICEYVTLLGGNIKTCYGLAGIGDLVLTCSSSTSRNYSAGFEIGKTSIIEFKEKNKKTVEGIFACEIAKKIAEKSNLEVPLISFIYNIVFNNESIANQIDILKKNIME